MSPARAWRWLRRTWLRWQIASTENYVRECHDDGLCDSLSMREFDSQIEDMRVRLAVMEAR